MKKFKKIMAIAVASVMTAAMCVPALAAGDYEDSGRYEADTGTIKVMNAKDGETYSVYRLFELVSFHDGDYRTGEHTTDTEQYSYAIAQYIDSDNDGEKDDPNPWWTFLTTTGPAAGTNWAIAETSSTTAAQKDDAYFLIEQDAITVTLDSASTPDTNSNYHIIKAGGKFRNWNASTGNGLNGWDSKDDMGNTPTSGSNVTPTPAPSFRNDNDGTASGIDYFVHANNRDVQTFAQAALYYAENNSVAALNTERAAEDGVLTVLSDGKLGYYLIGSSMGTLAALDTTNKNAFVYEKNDEPQITKKEVSVDGTNWYKNVDVDFEDYVEFKTEIILQQGMENYQLKDVMEDGLTLVKSSDADYTGHETTVKFSRTTGSVDVYVPANVAALDKNKIKQLDGTSNPSANVTTRNWELKTTNIDTGCDFEIHFSNANKDNDSTPTWPAGQPNVVTILGMDKATVSASTEFKFYDVKDGDKLTITYWAKLSNATKTKIDVMNSTTHPSTANKSDIQNASSEDIGTDVIDISTDPMNVLYENDGDGRNENYTILVYGDKSYTRWEKASVTTYKFDVIKTKDSKPTATNIYELLTGAKFKVYRVHESSTGNVDPADNETIDRTIGGKNYTIEGTVLKFRNVGNVSLDGKSVVSGTYDYAGDTASVTSGIVDELISNDETAMSLNGLAGGIYMIEETYAPTGYDQLSHPIIIEVTARSDEYNGRAHINNDFSKNTGTAPADDAFTNEGKISNIIINNVGAERSNQANASANAKITAVDGKASNTYNSNAEGQGGVQIINRTTSELPSTGGMGTTVLYIVGGMLVILAGAYLFFSRKRTA